MNNQELKLYSAPEVTVLLISIEPLCASKTGNRENYDSFDLY